jgi:peptidoglycan-N-acetylglucosamine deacetylase
MSVVTLTFDNGPDVSSTPAVLDVLARHDIRATFFVLGKQLAKPENFELAERARVEGHLIGNHSMTHKIPLGEDRRGDAAEREIADTERLIGGLASDPPMFRPFGGGGKIGKHLLSPSAVDLLTRGHYTCVIWNCVPEDWIHHDEWPSRAMAQVADEPHALVVLHDIYPPAMRHLARFIETLRDAGHTFSQEFPAACLPIVGGKIVGDISPIVADAPQSN